MILMACLLVVALLILLITIREARGTYSEALPDTTTTTDDAASISRAQEAEAAMRASKTEHIRRWNDQQNEMMRQSFVKKAWESAAKHDLQFEQVEPPLEPHVRAYMEREMEELDDPARMEGAGQWSAQYLKNPQMWQRTTSAPWGQLCELQFAEWLDTPQGQFEAWCAGNGRS